MYNIFIFKIPEKAIKVDLNNFEKETAILFNSVLCRKHFHDSDSHFPQQTWIL